MFNLPEVRDFGWYISFKVDQNQDHLLTMCYSLFDSNFDCGCNLLSLLSELSLRLNPVYMPPLSPTSSLSPLKVPMYLPLHGEAIRNASSILRRGGENLV